MGKNDRKSWLNAVKKAFRSPAKDNEEEEEEKKRGKKRWINFRKGSPLETTIQVQYNAAAKSEDPLTNPNRTSGMVLSKKHEKNLENSVSEQKSAITMAMATTSVQIIRLNNTKATGSSLLFRQQKAALFIQSVFRGYLARRALKALKGVVKLQALIRGYNVRRRTEMTLQCIQSLVRIQAQVCDQQRRLSCEITTNLDSMFSRKVILSTTEGNHHSDALDDHAATFEEIQALLHRAKEYSIKHLHTAHVLSQKIGEFDGDQCSDSDCNGLIQEHRRSDKKTINQARKDRNLRYGTDHTRTAEIETSKPYNSKKLLHHSEHDQSVDPYIISSPQDNNIRFHSPTASSSSKIKGHSSSPQYQTQKRNYHTAETPTLRSEYFHRLSMSEKSCPLSLPNYMTATASTIARLRSQSAPRQRQMSPCREQSSSAKKRLSFPFADGQNADDDTRSWSHKTIPVYEERSSCYTN